jgi:hypothetical protein
VSSSSLPAKIGDAPYNLNSEKCNTKLQRYGKLGTVLFIWRSPYSVIQRFALKSKLRNFKKTRAVSLFKIS